MKKQNKDKIFIATSNDEGRILLKFLIKILDNVPISRIYKLLRKKDVKVNGKRVSDSKIIIKENDKIWVYGLDDTKKEIVENRSKISFNVNFEDDNILVVEKPINIEIHGAENCLDQQVLKYLNYKKVDSFTPSHAHRIDRVTSGLVIYGKNYSALRILKTNVQHFEKIYVFKSDIKKSIVATTFLRHDETRHRIVEDKHGKKSITEFIVMKHKKIAILHTGHKHQIRATLSILGFPIYGDSKYGGKKAYRVFLHASEITLRNLNGTLAYLNNRRFKSQVSF